VVQLALAEPVDDGAASAREAAPDSASEKKPSKDDEASAKTFDPSKDLISLHYDHAPDKDDGHSAAADRTLLLAVQDKDWIENHVLPVSGAYGSNKRSFNKKSDAVMDAAWNDLGGWVAADQGWDQAVARLVERWSATLQGGGDVWVKEGGQSDITAAAVKQIRADLPQIDTRSRIHVVQHSGWNEKHTTPAALQYTKDQTDYIRIKDGNRLLNVKGGDKAFVEAATSDPGSGAAWEAAFDYFRPSDRVDFSDTCELLHILGRDQVNVDAFRQQYLVKPH